MLLTFAPVAWMLDPGGSTKPAVIAMSSLGLLSFVLAATGYVAATALFYLDIARGGAKPSARGPWCLGVAAIAHATHVTVQSFVAHVCPVHSVEFILSVAALLATAVFLGARAKFRIHALGLLVAPVGLVLTLATFFLGTGAPGRRLPASFIGLHVLANLTGIAMFLLACGAAVLYLVQERRLKHKSPAIAAALPSLDALARAVHRFLLAGFPLLTVGVATGTAWADGMTTASPQDLLRAILSYATWLAFGAVLMLRVLGGWRGRRAAYGTVFGFTCALMVLVFYLVRPLVERPDAPAQGHAAGTSGPTIAARTGAGEPRP